MADQDTEITVGSGKILGLFFGLVIICGLFFGAGYTVGKNAKTALAPSPDAAGGTVLPNGVAKPSPVGGQVPGKSQDCPNGECTASNQSELTFYKAVEQKTPDAQLTPAEPAPSPAVTIVEQKATLPEASTKTTPPQATVSSTGFVVQVAAVSKQQDAEALVSALRRKQYPVNVVPSPTDKLFHVQVGPFVNQTEAEAIRTRLIGDGYNPILKH